MLVGIYRFDGNTLRFHPQALEQPCTAERKAQEAQEGTVE